MSVYYPRGPYDQGGRRALESSQRGREYSFPFTAAQDDNEVDIAATMIAAQMLQAAEPPRTPSTPAGATMELLSADLLEEYGTLPGTTFDVGGGKELPILCKHLSLPPLSAQQRAASAARLASRPPRTAGEEERPWPPAQDREKVGAHFRKSPSQDFHLAKTRWGRCTPAPLHAPRMPRPPLPLSHSNPPQRTQSIKVEQPLWCLPHRGRDGQSPRAIPQS
jgi:hypothetical protein